MVSSFVPQHLSPLDPHLSNGGVNIWSSSKNNDGVDTSGFGGGWNHCIPGNNGNSNFSYKGLSSPRLDAVFNDPFSDSDTDSKDDEWSRSAVQSSGKECLTSEDNDDGWKDLETTLISALTHTHLQLDAPSEPPVTMDSDGRREITGEAVYQEMKRFSGVIRLQTFMEIFKVHSFLHMVEFFSVLRTRCNMVFDPKVGTMVIFKKHVYIPARKVTVKHDAVQLFARTRDQRRAKPETSKRSSPHFVIVKPHIGSKSQTATAAVSKVAKSKSVKDRPKAKVLDLVDAEGHERRKLDFEHADEKKRKTSRRRPRVRAPRRR